MVKYNFGSANKIIDGFYNVDIVNMSGVDIVWDLTKTPYPFVKEPVDEIIAQEFLEHIPLAKTEKVLREWYRILKSGGKATIQVPDIGKMCEMYVNGEICECVPHKAPTKEGYKPNPNCWQCGGKGKINPTRWLYAFTGTQKHKYEYHHNVFTKELLEKALKKAGFRNIEFKPSLYKLIAIVRK